MAIDNAVPHIVSIEPSNITLTTVPGFTTFDDAGATFDESGFTFDGTPLISGGAGFGPRGSIDSDKSKNQGIVNL